METAQADQSALLLIEVKKGIKSVTYILQCSVYISPVTSLWGQRSDHSLHPPFLLSFSDNVASCHCILRQRLVDVFVSQSNRELSALCFRISRHSYILTQKAFTWLDAAAVRLSNQHWTIGEWLVVSFCIRGRTFAIKDFGFCHSPVDFCTHSRTCERSFPLTRAHSRTLPLTCAHSRTCWCTNIGRRIAKAKIFTN